MPTSRPALLASTASDWSLSIPLSALVELQTLPERMKELEKETKRLKAENAALRDQFMEVMIAFGDLKK